MWLWAALIAIGGVAISLYRSQIVVVGMVVWFALTVIATFVVPRTARPGWSHGDDYVPQRPH